MLQSFVPVEHERATRAHWYTLRRAAMLLALLCIAPLLQPRAQTAQELEEILESTTVTYATAARFVLEAADAAVLYEKNEAFRYAQERGWLPAKAAAGDTATLAGVSLLLMRSFGVKGGIFYSIFKNSHYAYRELVYREIITGKTEPGMAVEGDDLLFMVGCFLTLREDQ